MILNDRIPGLPHWPLIETTERNDILVRGRHLSYAGLLRCRTSCFVTIILGSILILFLSSAASSISKENSEAAGAFIGLFIIVVSIVLFIRCINTRRFEETVSVLFTPESIVVNRQVYPLPPNLEVQFRAIRSPLPDHEWSRHQARRITKDKNDVLKFRSVEMIYGARIIFITSLADQHRAEQFAIALQIAHGMKRTKGVKAPGPPPLDRTGHLPE